MRLIGEIYMIPCPHCGKECKVTVFPNNPMQVSFAPEYDPIMEMPSCHDSYTCYSCKREIHIPYKIICVGYQTWNNSMKNDLTEASSILYQLSMKMKAEEFKS